MKKIKLLIILLATMAGFSQTNKDSINTLKQPQNATQQILNTTILKGITIGGYGQIDYNQKESINGTLDVHRMVLLLGYKFSDKVQLVTEIEYEHVKEVFIEQAFLNYTIANNINIRGGLMLIPMGIINEYHEPTTYNGVERPSVDKSIVPTTWREIGIGISGRIDVANLKYQAYVFNGFASVSGTKVLGGANGLRNGRQKGAESTISTPTFSSKVTYYGIQGLRLGFSAYIGRTQAKEELKDITGATVGITMIGLDARYNYKHFSARGQFINTNITDTQAYNNLHNAQLGSQLQGWYIEGAFNMLALTKEQKLIAFTRYENFNTHAGVTGNLIRNLAYGRKELTFGLSYHMAPGAVVKVDYQLKNTELPNTTSKNQLNVGLGFWF